MLLACGSEKKKSKSVKKHIKKLGTYELQINSDGQFNAFISTQEIKKPLLNFNPKDTIGKIWNIKIKTEKNWKIDSSFYVKNLGEFKRHINGIFGKIPCETQIIECWQANVNKVASVFDLSPERLAEFVKPAAILSFHFC